MVLTTLCTISKSFIGGDGELNNEVSSLVLEAAAAFESGSLFGAPRSRGFDAGLNCKAKVILQVLSHVERLRVIKIQVMNRMFSNMQT